jgi:hypothetical protein
MTAAQQNPIRELDRRERRRLDDAENFLRRAYSRFSALTGRRVEAHIDRPMGDELVKRDQQRARQDRETAAVERPKKAGR